MSKKPTNLPEGDARRKSKKMCRKGTVLIALGVLLLVGALALILYNRWDSDRAAAASEQIAKKLEGDIDAAKESEEEAADTLGTETDPVTQSPYLSMPTATVDGYDYIGMLDIPSVGIHLPVMHDWDMDRLKISACRYSGSYYEDDLVICGHNYAKTFSPIRWVAIGAEVTFTNVDGTVIRYQVSNIETVQPTAVAQMVLNDKNSDSSASWDLTLFTCNMGGQTRCAVRCVRMEDSIGS